MVPWCKLRLLAAAWGILAAVVNEFIYASIGCPCSFISLSRATVFLYMVMMVMSKLQIYDHFMAYGVETGLRGVRWTRTRDARKTVGRSRKVRPSLAPRPDAVSKQPRGALLPNFQHLKVQLRKKNAFNFSRLFRSRKADVF